MEQQTDIEGTITNIDPQKRQVCINHTWYDVPLGLWHQLVVSFPAGTEVKAGVVGDTIKSLVKQDPELVG